MPPDFDLDDDWLLLAMALEDAAHDDAALVGIPEIVTEPRTSAAIVVELAAASAAAAWTAVRRLEDVLREHGVEWAGQSTLRGVELPDT